tara:strand:+ start:175 stop:708 length:534 start_codon:yes stop_codon:yes gene_type:complete
MNIFDSVKICFQKYATFNGVARRSEFWFFYLFTIILSIVGISLDGNWYWYAQHGYALDFAPGAFMEVIAALVTLIPFLAVACRRLHDIGRSGWWLLIALTGIGIILLIVWWCLEGESTKNEIYNETNVSKTNETTQNKINSENYTSKIDEIKKWAELKESGAITEDEYQKKKEDLLK